MVLQQIAGYDRLDLSSVEHQVQNYSSAIGAQVSQFRLGVPPQFYDTLDDDVMRAVQDALALLNKITKGSREVVLPSLIDAGIGASSGTIGAESYYHEPYITRDRGAYQPQTIRILERGAQTKASDYIRTWRELQLIRRTVDDVFQSVDLLVTPTRRRTPRTVDAGRQEGDSDLDLFPGDRTFASRELIGRCVDFTYHRVGRGERLTHDTGREGELSERGVESRELIVTRGIDTRQHTHIGRVGRVHGKDVVQLDLDAGDAREQRTSWKQAEESGIGNHCWLT
jgi:Amidase